MRESLNLTKSTARDSSGFLRNVTMKENIKTTFPTDSECTIGTTEKSTKASGVRARNKDMANGQVPKENSTSATGKTANPPGRVYKFGSTGISTKASSN